MNSLTAALNFIRLRRAASESLLTYRQINTFGFPLQIKFSPSLWAEPLKPKKRIDPAIIKAREEKRKRKVEKLIRRRLKVERQLKPITENEIPKCLIDDSARRARVVEVSEEISYERILMFKKWSKVKLAEYKLDKLLISRLINSQKNALEELRLESEELYQAAVKIDEKFIPLEYSGPVETPSVKEYNTPDGEYIDISKKWIS